MAIMVDKGKLIKSLTIESFALLIALDWMCAVGNNKTKVLRLQTVFQQGLCKQGEIKGIITETGFIGDDYDRM